MAVVVPKLAVAQDAYRRVSFYYESARTGLVDLLRNVDVPGRGNAILLPAFIGFSPREGSGVFDPIQSVGARHAFYDVNDDLTVDLAALENALQEGSFAFVVVIHYYGRSEPQLERIRALTTEHGAYLIEDLAHGYFTAARPGRTGRTGDVQMYSLHKMLPLSKGGLMHYANKELVRGQRSTFDGLALRVAEFDAMAIADRRRRTFSQLSDRLRRSSEHGRYFELIWPELSDQDAPQTLPVRITGQGRDALYEHLNANGIGAVSLYHTLIPEVRANYPRAIAASSQIINLPVHQDMDDEHAEAVASGFLRALAELRSMGFRIERGE